MSMDEDDRRERIVRLEVEIEELAEKIERCRKIMLMSQAAIAAAAVLLLAIMLGAIKLDPTTLIAAIAIVIGGTVVLGSNRSTSQQAVAALRTAESDRAELIDLLDLPVAGDERRG
jgi:hypothetical protein